MARLVLHLPPVPASVTYSRHRLGDWLDEAGLDLGARTRDDLLVVVTELVTNGVIHDGGDDIAVAAEDDRTGVCVGVETSEAPRPVEPALREVADPSEAGRGLAIVGALADDLRTEICAGRRRVTCHVPRAHR